MKTSLLAVPYLEFLKHFQMLTGRGETFAKPLYKQVILQGEFRPEMLPDFAGRQTMLKCIQGAYHVNPLQWVEETQSGHTRKLVFATRDGFHIEAVVIPMAKYLTLCVSSQVGCAMGCQFCETARMGFLRNLTPEEIVGQFYFARHNLGLPIRNVVFMGMGEPLDNLGNVLQAVSVLTDDYGFSLKKGHITLSTSGHVEGIKRLARLGESKLRLAVSLNAATDRIRSRIMPINKRYNLSALKNSLLEYPLPRSGVLFLEYVLIDGYNDSPADAQAVIAFCEGLSVRINLIPCNPGREKRFGPPPTDQQEAFYQILKEGNLHVTRRTTHGQDILAACGQLATVF